MTFEAGRYDLIIVGAGPAGMAAAYTARQCGMSYLVLERDRVAQTIRDYPLGKPLHSPAQDVEMLWGEVYARDPRFAGREEVIAHYDAFAAPLNIRTGTSVRALERCAGGIRVHTDRDSYQGRRVLVATGGFGLPRPLGVPGESASRVSYRFVEGKPYSGQQVLVVGGGNSAAEAALWLHECGAHVTLSLRRPSFAPRDGVQDAFTSVKVYNTRRLEALAARGELHILFESHVVQLQEGAAIVRVRGVDGLVPCQHVFALLGADPDVSLLRGIGAEIAADGRPVYCPESFQTSVPGLFVAGHLTRAIHLTPAIKLPQRIVRLIAGQHRSTRGAGWPLDLLARAVKIARKKSPLARNVVRASPLLCKAMQRIEAANVMRDRRPSLIRQLIRRHPQLHRAARLLRFKLKYS